MSEQPTRAFKGVWIPVEIWDRTDITWMEKCLLAEINALDHGEGCWASNEFLACKFGSTPASIANILSKLRALSLLENTDFDGRRRLIKVKAGLTQRLRQPQPSGECSHNPAVIEKPVLYIEEKTEEKTAKKQNGHSTRFQEPTRDEVLAEAAAHSMPSIEADKFLNYYGANGWRVGRNPMKCWKRAFATWRLNWQERYKPKGEVKEMKDPDFKIKIAKF